ncbi:MAG: sigma 54-interacting transcriptional regulator [Myxococcota bacterium]
MSQIIDALGEIAERCARSAELDDALGPCLRLMAERLALVRGTLSLLDDERQQIWIEAAHGLTPAEIRRTRLLPNEGVTGQVIQTGQPIILERISDDRRFVDWRGIRERGDDPAFVSVPIFGAERRIIGALAACRFNDASPVQLQRDTRTLTVIAGLLAPLVRGTSRNTATTPFAGDRPDKQLQPDNLIGNSKAMRAVFEMLGQVAGSEATVLILGESGTGKELVAQALHRHSHRSDGAFVKVNCAALPEGVIESELFGHEKGSFTGALRQHQGKVERARGGTLFLDEIGELPPSIQVKLLRVLQEGEYERVGGVETLSTDARIIAATSRDLESMIADGSFRSDLYYRLNVFPIWMPPLRERKADILLLADHFIERHNRQRGHRVRRLSTSAIDMLVAYHWPGNVRELENCVERAVLLADGDVILGHHLPPTLQTAEASNTGIADHGLRPQVEAFEKELILDALKSARGNMAAAARQLQISERIMGLRVRKYAIDPERFKVRR